MDMLKPSEDQPVLTTQSLAQDHHHSAAERRGRVAARPDGLNKSLSFEQSVTLTAKEQFGWFVAFVRRPLFVEPEVVITNPDRTEYLLISEDGSTQPFYNVRNEDFV